MAWGILSPDVVVSPRRLRDLGLGAAVRHFNDRAVPGIGSMWFPMPLLWSLLAVSIAAEVGRPALPIGNAIEALMMARAHGRAVDPRLRGGQKLAGVTDLSFANLSRRGVYVVQPTRMGIVEPLARLGFVAGRRFGSFEVTPTGQRLLDLPDVAAGRQALLGWVRGAQITRQGKRLDALSPFAEVPPSARRLIRARLLDLPDGDGQRRRRLAALTGGPSARQLDAPTPLPGIEAGHWTDLRAGVSVIDLRAGAVAVLDAIEQELLRRRDARTPVTLAREDAVEVAGVPLEALRRLAGAHAPRIHAAGEPDGIGFVGSLVGAAPADIVTSLARRDGKVVRWDPSSGLTLGPAAGGATAAPDADTASDARFAPQLPRLYNLHCLVAELDGKPNPRIAEVAA